MAAQVSTPGQNIPNKVDLKEVRKAAQKKTGIRNAYQVPGAGPAGSDSRPGAFRQALTETKNATPQTLAAILTQVNRKLTNG